MLATILRLALRGIRRTRADVLITFVGMAIGLTAALMMALLTRDIMTYSRDIPLHGRTYMVTGTVITPGQAPAQMWMTPAPLAGLMAAGMPDVEVVTRFIGNPQIIRRGDIAFREVVIWADPTLFQVLPLPVVAGDPATALATTDGVVLTRSLARKLFSQDAPLDQTVDMGGQSFLVMAVVEDSPARGALHDGSAFASGLNAKSSLTAAAGDTRMNPAGFNPVFTHFRLKAGASAAAADRALNELLARHRQADDVGQMKLRGVALNDIPLDPELSPRSRALMAMMLVITTMTLIVPCINFVALATARAGQRAMEIGIAKLSGARRRHLITQFLLETTLLVAVAMVVAMSFTELALGPANRILHTEMALELAAPDVIAIILGLVLAVGMLAGAYPAFVLSSYRPGAILRGAGGGGDRSSRIRQALVVGQFMLLIALLSVTLVVHRQEVMLTHARLPYDPSNIVVLQGTCPAALRDRLAAADGVRSMACADRESLSPQGGASYKATLPDGSTVALGGVNADAAFLSLFHIEPLAGRLFDPARAQEAGTPQPGNTVIVNETAAHTLGWGRAEEIVGQTLNLSLYGYESRLEVVGVVPDFSLGDLEGKIPPLLFRVRGRENDTTNDGLIYVKLKDSGATTLAAVDAAWRALNPGVPVQRFFFDDHVAMLTLIIRLEAQIFILFSAVNVLMACAGIYGLSAFTAERRTKEIGVRKVYGASVADIVRLLLWQFAKPVLLAGVLVWIPTYWGLRQWLDSFATHVDVGPFTLLAPTALALAIAGLTVAGQSMRVAKAKPIRALRYE
ncbi:putative ABC transport system permease protein [Nitrospirillum amazonense]|uniref:Putative ABC transport system permease protein n=1 Tax=Nitrospirillum amazonense TaxID=28077 RepID=A0A560FS92_9PROT|nr:ABC transporter permease [Nitrospirillum amazonense]TWB24463.1 putative ABC transport system permease protein [Nitrospirillum amazonense]